MAMLTAGPAAAAPGGLLRTLLKGYWICETAGDATAPGRRLPADSFRVVADSSYRPATGGIGAYLLLGSDLTMTSGPFRGRHYLLVGQGVLHPLDMAGQRSTDRCVRQGSAGMAESGS